MKRWGLAQLETEEAKMQLHLHMLEFTTVKNLVVGGANR